MDMDFLAALIFSLLVIALIGGVILLFPLTRRLGKLLEQRLERGDEQPAVEAEVASLREAVHSLDERLRELGERQAFTEDLLERRRRAPLPEGTLPDEAHSALDEST